ncbi:hypothetical protein S40293_07063 [Stachybotrys chartarum IBT 40293]|nr:hypothetical protein S40293_07063 [Stachybotrys chartarum IBT 40293]
MNISLLSLALVAAQALAQSQGSCNDIRSKLLSAEWTDGTIVSFPEDGEDFTNYTVRWSSYREPTYVANVSPATEEDVALAIQFARDNDMEFLATGGRHGYTPGYGRLQSGLSISLENLNSVSVNQTAATLTVGGGVRIRDVTQAVADAGFEMPIGGCSCPGLVGVTLGGGITNWLGIHGLLIDVLDSVRIVTADSRIIVASETENSDLFWGLRGAGQNFGIVVEATYRLAPPTNNDEILVVDAAFPAITNVSYYTALVELLSEGNPYLTTNSIINWGAQLNQATIMANFHYMGPADEGMALLAPLLDLGTVMFNTHTIPWSEYHRTTLFGRDEENCQVGPTRLPFGAMTRNNSVESLTRSFSRMAKLYEDFPGARNSALVYHSYDPAAARAIPDDSTAFPWREAKQWMYVLLNWTPGDWVSENGGNAIASVIRDDFAATGGFDGLASYAVFGRGDETLEQIYTPRKLPQLAALKATWDPENVFKFHYPIPTTYP